jgi:hypothetical protein
VWQADDGFAFRLLGGYGYHPGRHAAASTVPTPMSPPELQQFLAAEDGIPIYGLPAPMSQHLFVSVRETLNGYHVRLVIVDRAVRGGDQVASMFTRVLGPPTVSSGPFRVWAESRPKSLARYLHHRHGCTGTTHHLCTRGLVRVMSNAVGKGGAAGHATLTEAKITCSSAHRGDSVSGTSASWTVCDSRIDLSTHRRAQATEHPAAPSATATYTATALPGFGPDAHRLIAGPSRWGLRFLLSLCR